jgi:hypothetical protein
VTLQGRLRTELEKGMDQLLRLRDFEKADFTPFVEERLMFGDHMPPPQLCRAMMWMPHQLHVRFGTA